MRRFGITEFTVDPMGLVFLVLCGLLIAGTIPFTPAWVGVILIVSQIHLSYTFPVR